MLQALGRSCVNRGLIQAPQSKGKNVIGLLSTLVLLWVLARREKSPMVPHGDWSLALPWVAGTCPEPCGLSPTVLKGVSSSLSDLHLHRRGG